MIITLEEAKEWLRIDSDEEDMLISTLVLSAEEYLIDATGRQFEDTNNRAKLFCFVLVTDWYENRELISVKPSEKVRFSIQSLLVQLQYAEVVKHESR